MFIRSQAKNLRENEVPSHSRPNNTVYYSSFAEHTTGERLHSSNVRVVRRGPAPFAYRVGRWLRPVSVRVFSPFSRLSVCVRVVA